MKTSSHRKPETATAPGAVLARAAFRAAGFLGVSQADLADIIGVSSATASRLAHSGKALEEGGKPW